MAIETSVSCSSNIHSGGGQTITANLYAKQESQSVDNNTSTIYYTFSAVRGSMGFNGTERYHGGKIQILINGSVAREEWIPLTKIPNYGIGKTEVSGSGRVNVSHNGDGSKSCSVQVKIIQGSDDVGHITWYWEGSQSGVAYLELSTIPRASNPSLSAGEATLGDGITINTNRKSSSFTHSLWWSCGSSGWKDIVGNVGDSYTWTIPRVIANYITSSTSATVTIICRTYNNGIQVGNDQYTSFTGKVPDDIVPSISNFSVWEAVSNVSSKFGVYLKGASKLGISFNEAGSYGSWITSRKINANNQTSWQTSMTTDYLYSSGNMIVEAIVTDSRGRSVSKRYQITVYDYGTPWVSSFKGIRCNSDGTANDGGNYIKLQFEAGVYSVSNKNTAQYQLGYRIADSGSYSWKTLDVTSLSYKDTTGVISGLTFSEEHSYDLILWVGDKLGNEARRPDTLATEFRLMDFYKDGTGMAIGKVAEQGNLFDVGLNSHFRKNLQLDNVLYPNITSPNIQNSGGGNSANYMHIATIKVNAPYINVPFVIEYLQRGSGGATRLHIRFNSSDTADPALGLFAYEGRCRGAYLVKTSTSIWNLYITKSEPWENIGITNICQYETASITITKVQNTNISSLPSGGAWASELSPLRVKDVNQSDNVTFAYSKSGMGFYDTSWLACWNGYELRAIARTELMDAWYDNSTEWSVFRFGNGLMVMKRFTRYTIDFAGRAWGSVYGYDCNRNIDQIPDYPVAFTSTPSRFISLCDGSDGNAINAFPDADGMKRPLNNFGGWVVTRPTVATMSYMFSLTAIGWWK